MERHKYNTQNKKLVLPEYGRNVQIMVDHLLTIEDRDERNKAAQTIIDVMGNLCPHLRDVSDNRQKLWDHLAIMADFKLDIDSPFPQPDIEEINKSPEKLPYPRKFIKYRHYGLITEKLINEIHNQPTDELKKKLALQTAWHMKKSYLAWNKDTVSDAQIFRDINNLYGMEILRSEDCTIGSTNAVFQKRNNNNNKQAHFKQNKNKQNQNKNKNNKSRQHKDSH